MQSVVDELLATADAGARTPISASTSGNVVTIRGPVFTADAGSDPNVLIDTTASKKGLDRRGRHS